MFRGNRIAGVAALCLCLGASGCGDDVGASATTEPSNPTAAAPTTSEAPDEPTTSTEVTDLPDDYTLSAHQLYPAEVRGIEAAAEELFGPRLAFVAGASDEPGPAIQIFVIRADAADLEAGENLSTERVRVIIVPAVASDDDLLQVAKAIGSELTANELGVEFLLSIQALDQIVTVGSPPGTDEEVVEQAERISRRVIDEEANRIADARPAAVNIDVAWSTQVLRFATVTVTSDDAPIG